MPLLCAVISTIFKVSRLPYWHTRKAVCIANVNKKFTCPNFIYNHFAMTGKKLREKLKNIEKEGTSVVFSDIASKLNMSRQAFNAKLNAKRLDFDFVKSVAAIISVPVSQLVNEEVGENILQEPNPTYTMPNQANYIKALERVAALSEKHIELQEKTILLQDQLLACKDENLKLMRQMHVKGNG